MEPQRLIGQAVNTDDHGGRYLGRLEDSAPLRDQLTVTGEHDCLGRICRDVHRDLPATVVIERLGDDLSRRSLVAHDRNPRSLRAAYRPRRSSPVLHTAGPAARTESTDLMAKSCMKPGVVSRSANQAGWLTWLPC